MKKSYFNSVLADLLMETFRSGQACTRKYLLLRIKRDHPSLVHRKLDLVLARKLNQLVDLSVLRRAEGKYYAPGERYT